MKKRKLNIKSRIVARAISAAETAALKVRLNSGDLPEPDIAALSRMIKLRKTGLRKLS